MKIRNRAIEQNNLTSAAPDKHLGDKVKEKNDGLPVCSASEIAKNDDNQIGESSVPDEHSEDEEKEKDDCSSASSESETVKIDGNQIEEASILDKHLGDKKSYCFPICSEYIIAKIAANLTEAASLPCRKQRCPENMKIQRLFSRYYKFLILNQYEADKDMDESSIRFPILSECESLEIASILTKASMAHEHNELIMKLVLSVKNNSYSVNVSPVRVWANTETYFKAHYKFLTDRQWT